MRKIIVVATLCFLLCGCASTQKVDELEKRIEYLESLHGIDSDLASDDVSSELNHEPSLASINADYAKAEAIELLYDFDPETKNSNSKYYQLRIWGDKSSFTYYDDGPYNAIYCDFSLDTYYEFLNMICCQPLEKYEPKTDSNGKLLYENVPCIMGLFLNASDGAVYFKDPTNMDEIIARFEELKDSAIQ